MTRQEARKLAWELIAGSLQHEKIMRPAVYRGVFKNLPISAPTTAATVLRNRIGAALVQAYRDGLKAGHDTNED